MPRRAADAAALPNLHMYRLTLVFMTILRRINQKLNVTRELRWSSYPLTSPTGKRWPRNDLSGNWFAKAGFRVIQRSGCLAGIRKVRTIRCR